MKEMFKLGIWTRLRKCRPENLPLMSPASDAKPQQVRSLMSRRSRNPGGGDAGSRARLPERYPGLLQHVWNLLGSETIQVCNPYDEPTKVRGIKPLRGG
jgi:hypothetical protein